MPVLPAEAYDTLGVTHDHDLLGVTFDPTARRFGLHFEGAYLLDGADWPEREYVDVRVTVEAWQEASFAAQVAQPLEKGPDPSTLPMMPFDPREHRLREVLECDLTPDVALTGWLEEQRGELFRWFCITFRSARVTVSYDRIAPISRAPQL
ncbi:hypothetical protein GCM10008955_17560 [Deinococcus malanensis]|uniref:Uncharacterized protein n=1 Tax=Deinococcus malanensis TaxID=1706855 RepID=A0ABQ2EVW9_9DEIO|nr:hypothetical protein [Deinococcus malanensis]GGK24453.1 hypothetical protein GCM10008955_17560 [Deinococcus malanensis]